MSDNCASVVEVDGGEVTVSLTVERYKILRDMGVPPRQVREKLREVWGEPKFGIEALISVVIGVVSFCIVDSLVSNLIKEGGDLLWLVSPSRKTTVQLPFRTALRVVRKHGWSLAAVEPVRPVRRVTRWEAVKILVQGAWVGRR